MKLEEVLGYQFKQPDLLQLALTHRSSSGENNERIEFLGDAVVNFIVAEFLYNIFPKASEGDLSRFRATLVNRDTLASFARKFNLGPHLILGVGEQRSGGNERHSILSCAMEAIIGAIYLDGGYERTKEVLHVWYQPLLQSLTHPSFHKDPKTLLQEYLQSQKLPLPVYAVTATEGEAHQQVFIVSCHVDGLSESSTGRGTSRRRAEQEAAQALLEVIKK